MLHVFFFLTVKAGNFYYVHNLLADWFVARLTEALLMILRMSLVYEGRVITDPGEWSTFVRTGRLGTNDTASITLYLLFLFSCLGSCLRLFQLSRMPTRVALALENERSNGVNWIHFEGNYRRLVPFTGSCNRLGHESIGFWDFFWCVTTSPW